MRRSLAILLLGIIATCLPVVLFAQVTFSGNELLGNPTDKSITINIVPDSNIDVFYQFRTTQGGPYTDTPVLSASAGEPHEVVIDNLQADTRYFYRMQYSTNGGSNWTIRAEHSFRTARSVGSTYKIALTADSHVNIMLGNLSEWQSTLDLIADDQPDFLLDLGDTFAMDGIASESTADAAYLYQRDPSIMGRVSPSVPIFLAMGNHENEEGWNFDDVDPQPIFGMKARKRYFPLPSPLTDPAFYSANTDPVEASDVANGNSHIIGDDQYREDYYSWTWGDALFIVFDPFQYTMQNPYGASAGEGGDEIVGGDRWNWTMGVQQHQWLKETLENSHAKYKFMFAHHMLGGTANYVRGGAEGAHMFEWGGYEADGTTYGFTSKRPAGEGWLEPVHEMMKTYDVSAFFHGHDHHFVLEERDGIVYQLVPAASQGTGLGFNNYTSSPYVVSTQNNSGYLRMTVSPNEALVEYVKSTGSNVGQVQYAYTIEPNGGGTGNTPPTAVASATPTSGDAPLSVSFTGSNSSDSDGSIASYAWDFGDGGTATTANPSHTYNTAGNYTAILTVTDNEGATDTDQVSITVTNPGGENQPPVPVIASPQSGQNYAAGAIISFSGSATDPEDGNLNASTAEWRVAGPGIPVNYVIASGTFSGSGQAPSTGNYSITLEVQDSQGLSATTTTSFTVGGSPNTPPTAVASATPTSGEAPLLVNFTGSNSSDSDGSITSYSWNFGDGNNATTANPSHTYSSAGNYTATLTVTDDDGATDNAQVTISVNSPPNEPPTAVVSADPTSGEAPLTVNFTGSNSSDSDGSIATYAWTFGDGITANTADPSHTYANAGNYTATLTVTDNQGATDEAHIAITVTQTGNNPPTAVASADPTSGEAPLAVNFTGSNSSDSDGSIASYAWTFGDGGTANTANPSHTYNSAGNYTAELTVTDDDGATDVAQVAITVNAPQNQPPTAVASANPTSGTVPLAVNFTGSNSSDSDGSIATYTWTFGDGGTANTANPSHTYNSAGNYTVTLTVTDDDGATDDAQVAITVNEPANTSPVATITQPVNNTNYSVGQVASYSGTGTDAEDGTVPASRFRWFYSRNGGAEVQFATGQTSGSIVAAASGSYAVILEVE
ncbi:MAG: PKD domain-containing protein, partial [Calditrichaeota bacterium]